MIRIAITVAAFDAIAATLPVGSVAVEPATDEKGERLIWLEPHVINKLRHLRAGRAKAIPTSSSDSRCRTNTKGPVG